MPAVLPADDAGEDVPAFAGAADANCEASWGAGPLSAAAAPAPAPPSGDGAWGAVAASSSAANGEVSGCGVEDCGRCAVHNAMLTSDEILAALGTAQLPGPTIAQVLACNPRASRRTKKAIMYQLFN